MADGYALAMQVGLVAALKADAAVTAIVGQRIYDEPPQNATYPFLHITDISPSALDTDHTEGATLGIGLAAHSRATQGRVEAVQIAEAVKAALHRQESAVTVTGFNLIELIFQTFVTDRLERGHSVRMSFQAILETPA